MTRDDKLKKTLDESASSESGSEGEKMNKEEQIGFHKGSINTLIAERNELLRIIQVTESLIQAHAKELEKLGIKINSE